jgi:hypothetical protein
MNKTHSVIIFLILLSTGAWAQSAAEGTILVKADFNNQNVDKAIFGITSWNIPETWEQRDGALASIYDPKQHSGKAHGTSISPRIKARDVRVSYRVKFEDESARISMLINTPLPSKTGVPVWHIGDVYARLPRNPTDAVVSIVEREFTYDENDPRLIGKKKDHGPADIFKPYLAYSAPGISCKSPAALVKGQWHQFVLENVGTQWTLWIDGKEVLTQVMKHSDYEKETVNFIAFAPLLLNDIVIEELGR